MKHLIALFLLTATTAFSQPIPDGDTNGTLSISVPSTAVLSAAGSNQMKAVWWKQVADARVAWAAATNANPFYATTNTAPVAPVFAVWLREKLAPDHAARYAVIVEQYHWQLRAEAISNQAKRDMRNLFAEGFWLQTPAAQAAQSNDWRATLSAAAP